MLRYALPLLALLAFAAACSGDDNIESNDIVTDIPDWSAPGVWHYQVTDNDNDDEVVGTLEMTVEVGDNNTTTFRQYFEFPDRDFINAATVVVDSETLQPQSTDFLIHGPEGNLACGAEYGTGEVNVHRVGEDGERDDSVDVPHNYYDSWSDLFVWRTLDFSEDFEIDYADVLSCTLDRTQLIGVGLEVTDIEEIEVPAGTYEAWHLRIDSGGETQDAWYTTDDSHTLIRYDNGEITFELTDGR